MGFCRLRNVEYFHFFNGKKFLPKKHEDFYLSEVIFSESNEGYQAQ